MYYNNSAAMVNQPQGSDLKIRNQPQGSALEIRNLDA